VARLRGEFDKAQAMLRRATVLLQGQDDREGEAEALQSLATIARRNGDFTAAFAFLDRAVELSHEQSPLRVKCGNTRGSCLVALGKWAEAERELRAALQLAEEQHDEQYARWIVHNLGLPPMMRGDFGEALRWLRRSLPDERNAAPMPQETLREQFPDTVLAGNLRVSALEALPRITAGTPVVLELSSWQLEGLGEAQLSSAFACVTNMSPDHLDRYGSMEAYAEAKQQIFLWQPPNGVAVLNRDDPIVSAWSTKAPGRVAWFGARPAELAASTAPACFYDEAGIWEHEPAAAEQPLALRRICDRDDIRLAGAHNLANVAAAAALARAFGIEIEHIRNAIRTFAGVEHRLEFVRESGGVGFVNDTAATAPEAAIAALYSFKRPVILLAGGADKNLPFDDLARAIHERAKAVVLLEGTATAKLRQALAAADQRPKTKDQTVAADRSSLVLGPSPLVVGPFGNFAQAIAAARELAEPGDVVLLSPGCASFGMFRNEFHRGEEFRRIVNQF
jgi:UDP-N-acetylmuramoylalanine--D-glutamate ligase